jgi:hypothetical protein
MRISPTNGDDIYLLLYTWTEIAIEMKALRCDARNDAPSDAIVINVWAVVGRRHMKRSLGAPVVAINGEFTRAIYHYRQSAMRPRGICLPAPPAQKGTRDAVARKKLRAALGGVYTQPQDASAVRRMALTLPVLSCIIAVLGLWGFVDQARGRP